MNEKVIHFTRGVPAKEAFPTEKLQECALAALERYGDTLLQYHSSLGFLPLREWVAERYGVAAEQVFLGNGSLEILRFLAELLVEPGELVFVEAPSYDRAITIFRRIGARVVGVPMKEDGLDVNFLADRLKEERAVLLYTIPDFQNPSGATASLEKRRYLVELAKKHKFWIVEDIPYRDLRYWGKEQPTLWSSNPQWVLQLSSFSKVLSPGLRVGYLVGPEEVISQVAQVAEDTYITPSMLSQGVVYEFCHRGWLLPNIERLKELYRPRLKAMLAALDRELKGASWFSPQGGFFVGVTLPEGIRGEALQEAAEAEGLLLSDGRGFFPGESGEHFLRLPFCALTPEDIQEGAARLGRVISDIERS